MCGQMHWKHINQGLNTYTCIQKCIASLLLIHNEMRNIRQLKLWLDPFKPKPTGLPKKFRVLQPWNKNVQLRKKITLFFSPNAVFSSKVYRHKLYTQLVNTDVYDEKVSTFIYLYYLNEKTPHTFTNRISTILMRA